MTIWLKINNDFGFVGVSRDLVDNSQSCEEIDELLGKGTREYIDKLIDEHCKETGAFELSDSVITLLKNLGWTHKEELFRMNADVQAPAFVKEN